MSASLDHILILGYGAPGSQQEIPAFLNAVTLGRNIPKERIEEVRSHYEAIGSRSPYVDEIKRFARSLEDLLTKQQIHLPVFIAMRYSEPSLAKVLQEISDQRLQHGFCLIPVPHRSHAGYERYREALEAYQPNIRVSYTHPLPWETHPKWIEAHAQILAPCLKSDTTQKIIFTTHAVPQKDADKSDYEKQFRKSCEAVAKKCALTRWTWAYQSRSGSPRETWTGPDIKTVLWKAKEEGIQEVVFNPIGFVCENAEILYDLDLESRLFCETIGLGYSRVPTILHTHEFLLMWLQMIQGGLS